jgi:hypothetical protein
LLAKALIEILAKEIVVMLFTPVVIVLVAISIVGAIAIPFGDPQFLDRAIALELSFIALAVLTYRVLFINVLRIRITITD